MVELWSRRAFGRHCAGATAAVLATGFASSDARGEGRAKEFPPGRFVDVHTHLGQTWNTTADAGSAAAFPPEPAAPPDTAAACGVLPVCAGASPFATASSC